MVATKQSLRQLAAACAFLSCMGMMHPAVSQSDPIPLQDLSSFQQPGESWQIIGDLRADLNKPNVFSTTKGTGILLNLPDKKKHGKDLFTRMEHGDMDLELDFMMAKGSNSGIYLQGLYELQLADSWGAKNVNSAINGGVYERWDESKHEGQKGYQGYAPRQNVSRAPGLWQHLKVSFQAPRFDASGKKIENARVLKAELNGVTIHEDLELFGPTRGAISNEEKAKGPLRIQGDHGAVAFRNVKMTSYTTPRPELANLKYTVYQGKYEVEPRYDTLKAEAEGTSAFLTSHLNQKTKQFLIRYQGNIQIKEAGEYSFSLTVPGGVGVVRINNQDVIPLKQERGKEKVTLPAGNLPFELIYAKSNDWFAPGLVLAVSGPSLREFLISDKEVSVASPVDPIMVDARERPVLRSFMDLPGNVRVTHAVSVGSQQQVHYTYDLGSGTLVQLWRGGFLDATPMWHDRGDGSSRPDGAVQHLGKPQMALAKLSSDQSPWVADTTGSLYRSKGYTLSQEDQPNFIYEAFGAKVQDVIRVLDNGQGVRRELTIQNPAQGLYVRLAEGSKIEEVSKGTYLVDGKAYYLKLEELGGAKPVMRNIAGRQELIVPATSKLSYSILF
jgi:hypothetical protein